MKKKTKIMELKLVRFAKKKGYTIGHLYCLGGKGRKRDLRWNRRERGPDGGLGG